jgi:hypothetical protein
MSVSAARPNRIVGTTEKILLAQICYALLPPAEQTGREKRTSGHRKNAADLRHNSHVFDDSTSGNVIRYSVRLSHSVGWTGCVIG